MQRRNTTECVLFKYCTQFNRFYGYDICLKCIYHRCGCMLLLLVLERLKWHSEELVNMEIYRKVYKIVKKVLFPSMSYYDPHKCEPTLEILHHMDDP